MLPSPLTQIFHPDVSMKGIRLFMKRDDLIHPEVSGNKWRKLLPFLEAFQESGKSELLSLGGAYSNHIAALAAAGRMLQVPTVGIIRGDAVSAENATLTAARANGMKLKFVERSVYRQRNEADWLAELQSAHPHAFVIPEGGSDPLALTGVAGIVEELGQEFDILATPCGTGTTLAGLLCAVLPDVQVWGFSALKGDKNLGSRVQSFIERSPEKAVIPRWQVWDAYHFGGFARWTPELIDFIRSFRQHTGILLDPVYTSKMMYGLFDLIRKDVVPPGSRVLAIHTGGLQGWNGFRERFGIRIP